MSDDRAVNDEAPENADLHAALALQEKLDEFDRLMEKEQYKPITPAEYAQHSAACPSMTPWERRAWRHRQMFDRAHALVLSLRAKATGANAGLLIDAAMMLTQMRYELNTVGTELDAYDISDQLKNNPASKHLPALKGHWPPPGVRGRQWRSN